MDWDRLGRTDGGYIGGGNGNSQQESLGEWDGPEWDRFGMDSVAGLAVREDKTISVSRVCVVVRAVLWGGSGRHSGGHMSDPVWDVQHLKQSEQAAGVRLVWDVPSEYGTGSFLEN